MIPFLLISFSQKVSAYIAILAMFLTQLVPDYITTMEVAVKNDLKICRHPTMAEALMSKWPNARFVFSESKAEFYRVLKDYQERKSCYLLVART